MAGGAKDREVSVLIFTQCKRQYTPTTPSAPRTKPPLTISWQQTNHISVQFNDQRHANGPITEVALKA